MSTVREVRARLRPGRGCQAVNERTVTCARRGEVWRDDIDLRNGADVAQFSGTPRGIEIRLDVSALAGAQRVSLEAFIPARAPRLIAVATGAGNDTISGGRNAESLRGGPGNDSLRGRAGADDIGGGPGEDTLAGGAGPDVLGGGAGDDELIGGPGGDSLSGGDGADLVVGGAGRDLVQGEAGRDRIVGGAGDDRLVGDVGGSPAGQDRFFDQFFGGFGDDTLLARDGVEDYLDGGIGSDRACTDSRLDRRLRVETLACQATGARLTGRARL